MTDDGERRLRPGQPQMELPAKTPPPDGGTGPGRPGKATGSGRDQTGREKTIGRIIGVGIAILVMMIVLMLNSSPAVEPGEVLEDAGLEERAREISRHLRCLVCQNETIDESNAPLAADLRVLVRQLLASGKDDQEVLDHIVSRYGEFVLFKPLRQGANWMLYLAGPTAFMLALLLVIAYIVPRRRKAGSGESGLEPKEQELLDRLLADDDAAGTGGGHR